MLSTIALAMGLRSQPISDDEFYRRAASLREEIKTTMKEPARHQGIRRIQDIFRENEHRLFHWADDRALPADNNLAILSIAVCAIVCGATTFDAIAQWGKLCSQSMLSRLGCRRNPKTGRYEPPSESAIRRFLQSLDPQAVDAAITGWVESILGPGAALSIDGKTLRGARTPTGHQVQLLSAVLHHEAAVVAQEEVPSTTNEITVVKSLLQPVALEGTVVTADALHTQRETARYLVEEKQAHYLFTAMTNQPSLKKDLEDLNLVDFPPSAPDH